MDRAAIASSGSSAANRTSERVPASERLTRLAPALAGLALAIPIVVVRYPPMGDLAMHEGLVAIMRHLHDPSWVPQGLYYVVAPCQSALSARRARR